MGFTVNFNISSGLKGFEDQCNSLIDKHFLRHYVSTSGIGERPLESTSGADTCGICT